MTRSGSGQAGLLSQQIRPPNPSLQSGDSSSHANSGDRLHDSPEGGRSRQPAAGFCMPASRPNSRPSSVADVDSVPDDGTAGSQHGMRSTRAEKVRRSLIDLCARVCVRV